MSDAIRPPGDDTAAARGKKTPDARGETAVGTPASDTSGIGTGSTIGTGTPGTREGGPSRVDEVSASGAGISGPRAGEAVGGAREGGAPLLPHEECDKLAAQLQHAVTGFVDGPRDAVEEADHVLEELTERFTDAVTRRRRTLRMSWQSADAGGGKPTTSTDTEQLRLALRDYRELAERLLHV